ncbi:hypothetical protein F4810DRAFT_616073 [Camillea tinctor]|nr:hypothetical protein F4810DRAFT_616073 [Camillea tinctor]
MKQVTLILRPAATCTCLSTYVHVNPSSRSSVTRQRGARRAFLKTGNVIDARGTYATQPLVMGRKEENCIIDMQQYCDMFTQQPYHPSALSYVTTVVICTYSTLFGVDLYIPPNHYQINSLRLTDQQQGAGALPDVGMRVCPYISRDLIYLSKIAITTEKGGAFRPPLFLDRSKHNETANNCHSRTFSYRRQLQARPRPFT